MKGLLLRRAAGVFVACLSHYFISRGGGNFVVRNFVVGNFVVLIKINSVREKSLFELFNYLIIKMSDLNKFHFDTTTESKS